MTRGPFRADHVGSLLRPDYLKEARAQHAAGAIDAQALRALEDRAIREAVALQEQAGMKAITDGEFRRAFWHVDFLTGFDGVEATQSDYAVSFKGKGGALSQTKSMLSVTGKVGRSKPIMLDSYRFLKSVTQETPKVCIPSPTYMHLRGGRKVVADAAYPDPEAFWADMVAAYHAEIADLAQAGLSYLQLDDVSFATICDAGVRDQVRADGLDPDALPAKYAHIVSAIVAGRPAGMTVTMHTCRGNHDSMWMAEGGYDAVADAMLNLTDVDGFFMEYDTERAGSFAPLRFAPKGKKIVLGLVSSKEAAMESKDDLKRRIDEAARYVPLDQLCISPQCGFASTTVGNRITEDVERRKLALCAEVALEVWGAL
ncbi:MAG: 5-methyltetrahydropteroyltriglutamate--homocysteine methyltransferase [Hyphomicrobiales bacterium]|nr:5-methyltetrahydropteroyltriglutamate--homocysteine methyltransferase [Hyphomicrobiales bacterium]